VDDHCDNGHCNYIGSLQPFDTSGADEIIQPIYHITIIVENIPAFEIILLGHLVSFDLLPVEHEKLRINSHILYKNYVQGNV